MTATAPALCARETRAIYRASQILERLWADKSAAPQLGSPDTAQRFFRLRLATLPREYALAALLDSRNRLLAVETLHMGTAINCEVHPREVARAALLHNAVSVILAHNHPSGDPTPSRADIIVTERIADALRLIDVRLQDHIIVGLAGTVSMRETNCMSHADMRYDAWLEQRLEKRRAADAHAAATRAMKAAKKAAGKAAKAGAEAVA